MCVPVCGGGWVYVGGVGMWGVGSVGVRVGMYVGMGGVLGGVGP